MQAHVDPLGGWSGDMFVAACLDAFPQAWPEVQAAVAALDLGPAAACRLVQHHDGALTGHRFVVAAENEHNREADARHHSHGVHHHHDDHHRVAEHGPHRAWSDIRTHIEAACLDRAVTAAAIGIFALLAEAEGEVHGVSPDAAMFHEVGAVDSIVDIVAAAVLIERVGGTWSAAPLPLGGGRIRTAHGILPVPAPATALLLRGLETIDDGIAGERVTPTGAAIARYLLKDAPLGRPVPRKLVATGTGFGTRTLPGLSNCLRILVFQEEAIASTAAVASYAHRELAVIAFEVDDQSAEDLSLGLDHIRAVEGVHDVVQSVVFGKKGRVASHIQVLVAPEQREAAVAACFAETTTIGLRCHKVEGATLPRSFEAVEIDGRTLRVKLVRRPDGHRTGKTEAADVADRSGHAARDGLRRDAAAAALAQDRGGSDRLRR